MPSFFFRRFGQYLCHVTVTTDDEAPPSERHRAHLDQVERETPDGHIPVAIKVADGLGPTKGKAMTALEKLVMAQLREQAR